MSGMNKLNKKKDINAKINEEKHLQPNSNIKPHKSNNKKKSVKIKRKLILEDEHIEKKKTRTKQTKKKKLILIETDNEHLKASPKERIEHMSSNTNKPNKLSKVYNEEFIELLGELKDIMQAKGEVFRARAYQTAQETIMLYEGDITSIDQLKGLSGIGETILSKLSEYVNTGTIKALETGRKDPIITLTKVYGIGPKKAKDLIDKGVTTIPKLRENKNLLNKVQQVGLKYYSDILEKIPRQEIDEYNEVFKQVINDLNIEGLKYEIVGSYRRGKTLSGDIDVIITDMNENGDKSKAKTSAFNTFLDALISKGLIIEILTRGQTKSLTISKLPGMESSVARRIDFLYTPPNEYSFAVLYFTGSKSFNMVMRQRALNLGYTLNEHGLSVMKKGLKGELVKTDNGFPDEKSIFDFLDMEYKSPEERMDGRAVENKKIKSILLDEENGLDVIGSDSVKIKEKNTQIKLIKEKANEEGKELKQKQMETSKKVTLKNKKINIVHSLETFKQEGISALKLLLESELSELIQYANNEYYCKGTPVMTDNQYDILIEYTLNVYPDNEIAKEGHTGCIMKIKKNKVTLPYQMWSMDKIKPDTLALQKWMDKYQGDYVISCKLDGVSGLYVTEGKTPKLYTRGNGSVGQDISYLIPYLRLPKDNGLAIRGEFIVSKSIFKDHYANQFANPRNFVAGIINQTKVNPKLVSDIRFVAYELIKPERVPSEQFQYLKGLDIDIVQYKETDTLSNEILSETLLKWRDNYEYEIDGVICTNDKSFPRLNKNPEHAFAFKMVLSEQVAEAKVMDVLWSPSKDGVLKPRVQIEPVILSGVKIEFATGFNAKFIVDNKIGLGAIVQIVRSGDVIPHILGVTVSADKPLMPSLDYVWNETHTDILLVNIEENVIVKEKNIELFFSKLGVEGLKIGKVKKLVSAGYNEIPQILKMSVSDFEKIEGFGKKSSLQLVNHIREKLEDASLIKLMIATNFARGMGEKKLEPIFEMYPDILTSKMTHNEKIGLLQNVKGIAKQSAERFVSNISEFLNFLKETGLLNKLTESGHKQIKTVQEGHELFGKKIVMTGFRDKQLEETLIHLGVEIAGSVTKNVFMVLVKDLEETTGKAQKARELNIPLMTLDTFKSQYGL